MKSEDYFVNAMSALAVFLTIVLLAAQADKINKLEDTIKDLRHKVDLIENCPVNHSQIK